MAGRSITARDTILTVRLVFAEHRSRVDAPFHEKTNIAQRKVSTPDQPKHAAQANPGKHFSPPVDYIFQESLLYPPDTECVSPNEPAQSAQANPG